MMTKSGYGFKKNLVPRVKQIQKKDIPKEEDIDNKYYEQGREKILGTKSLQDNIVLVAYNKYVTYIGYPVKEGFYKKEGLNGIKSKGVSDFKDCIGRIKYENSRMNELTMVLVSGKSDCYKDEYWKKSEEIIEKDIEKFQEYCKNILNIELKIMNNVKSDFVYINSANGEIIIDANNHKMFSDKAYPIKLNIKDLEHQDVKSIRDEIGDSVSKEFIESMVGCNGNKKGKTTRNPRATSNR